MNVVARRLVQLSALSSVGALLAIASGCASAPPTDDTAASNAGVDADSEDLTGSFYPRGGAFSPNDPTPAGTLAAGDCGSGVACSPPALPSHFDWVDRGQVTPVRTQAMQDCWAFSTTAAFESSVLIARGHTYAQDPVRYSVEEVVACDPDAWLSNHSGGYATKALDFMVNHGLVADSTFPYTGRVDACRTFSAPHAHAASWGFLPSGDVSSIKTAISTIGPVVTAVFAGNVWDPAPNRTPKPGVLDGGHHTTTNHLVVITGWDDAKQAWHIKNSWGTGWAEHGYVWLKYGTGGAGLSTMWVRSEAAAPPPPPPPPPPTCTTIGSGPAIPVTSTTNATPAVTGGAIPPGTYDLAIAVFTGQKSTGNTPNTISQTIQFNADGTFALAGTWNGAATTESGTYATSGTTITFSSACPSVAQASFPYSVATGSDGKPYFGLVSGALVAVYGHQ